jgi:replicative DNA helicase|tara:strand:- start:56509 stop:57855 length:1347 start_codon:yes stop_codon:yes gene_type:complete
MKLDTKTFEHSILYQAVKSPYYLGTIIEHVDTDFFKDTDVKAVFGELLSFYTEYDKYPNMAELKTIISNEEVKKSFIRVVDTFKGLDTDIDIDILVEQTENYFREKSIVNTLMKIGKTWDELTHAEISERVQRACAMSIVTDIGFDYFKDIDTHIDWLKSSQNKLSTGFEFLDGKLKGGFNQDGRAMYVFMGGTNAGKSIVLGNLAANCVRQGKCVPIISLEMDEQLYAQRMSANFAEIPFDDLKDETEQFKAKIQQIKTNTPDANLILKEFPPGKLTVSGLDAYLEKLQKKGYDFDIVFLDYITLMRAEGVVGMYEGGKKLAEDIRALSYKYGVSFVTVIQANRGGVGGEQPQLDNTSESMGIAHTADFIASIWRTEEDIETNTLRLGILKNRVGENFGVQMLELDTRYLKLREVAQIFENDQAEMNTELKQQIGALSMFEEIEDPN